MFLQEKPTLVLLAIWFYGRTYASVITKEINSTFAHTTKVLSRMEEDGLVQFSFEGRIKYVELTEKGTNVVSILKDLIISLDGELPDEYDVEGRHDVSGSELDTASAEIFDIVKKLRFKIESIYKELIDSGADAATIKRKLGPFSRDMAMIGEMINSSETPVDTEVIRAYDTTRDVFSSLLNKNG
ncbi:HTH transcriptional regulator, MarR/SlyA family [Methanococcoides burtonii DSM 6242]|uniref:HTH transcriptional regulator, MarR/SlyA family n=1 Tax=Methanococcoides burtonii (strain DSM 6242 / NBRC 107633 / OCM 468 / ACE-M) TaxID=259564 RepID=Q12Y47_METBU|nr:HTH transcriptional regulator, MarR/SlyA family [Methanococcoides burtonii DSM 6242]